VTWAHWVTAILYNGLSRHQQALAAARQATEHAHVFVSMWVLPELIEAAVHTGDTRVASDALDLLTETTRAGGTDLGLGIEARSLALLSEGKAAEDCYREAIGRLGRTRRRPDLARAHLLFGEWLRRERRRGEARDQPARTRPGQASELLTSQEAQVARLARDGLSNPEIAARLFISVRTVQYHLSKVFAKLGIKSRAELHRVLPNDLGTIRV